MAASAAAGGIGKPSRFLVIAVLVALAAFGCAAAGAGASWPAASPRLSPGLRFTDTLPGIYHALTVEYEVQGQPVRLVLEVQQHLADNWVRTVSMSGSEGFKRGYELIDTGAPISVPVGEGEKSSRTRTLRRSTPRSLGP